MADVMMEWHSSSVSDDESIASMLSLFCTSTVVVLIPMVCINPNTLKTLTKTTDVGSGATRVILYGTACQVTEIWLHDTHRLFAAVVEVSV